MDGVITVGDKLNNGRIYIDGALNNAVEGPEITVTNATANDGAITIDYDGYEADDNWDPNAVISLASQSYTSNDLSVNIFRTSKCRGDLNNDGVTDQDDEDIFDEALWEPVDFANGFVGCEGSRVWHGDANANGAFNSADEDALEILVANECCIQDWPCSTDLDHDWDTDLDDLAALLGDYGCTEDCVGDTTGDDDTDLSDLAELLGHYGEDCDCSGEFMMESSAYVDVSVVAFDTKGYTGGGFYGEVDHFVFDLKIEVSQPSTDDWLVSGAALTADNDATFRLSTYPTTPNQYATFVAAPWTTLPGSSTANVAGTYDPADPNAVFTTSEANLGWYDTDTASNDGPATVMRIVIDVSEVDGADVSGGFGSVYFSTTGPANKDDILVAELASGTGTKLTEDLKTYGGEFYVIGQ